MELPKGFMDQVIVLLVIFAEYLAFSLNIYNFLLGND